MLFILLIYLAFVSLGLPDSLLGSSWPLMQGELGVPVSYAGPISMVVSLGTIVSSLLSVRLIQRFGTGKVTVVSVLMTALALLGFSLSPTYLWLILCAIPLGLGAGAVDAGLNEFVAEHLEAKHMSWLHCSWGIGAMLGPLLISLLAQNNPSWRSSYGLMFIIQIGLVILLLFSLPTWKLFEMPNRSSAAVESTTKPQELLGIQGVGFALVSFFLYTSIEHTFMLWGSSYLVETQSMHPERAAGWVSLFFLGITLGRLFSGFVSMKLENDTLVFMGCGLVLFGVILLLLPLPQPVTLLSFIVVGLGLAPVFPSLLHQTPVYFGKEKAQAIMGLQMAFAYTGVTFMPPLFGQLFQRISFQLMGGVLLVCAIGLLYCTRRLAKLTLENAAPEESLARVKGE